MSFGARNERRQAGLGHTRRLSFVDWLFSLFRGGRLLPLSSLLVEVARFRSFMVACRKSEGPVVGMGRSEIGYL